MTVNLLQHPLPYKNESLAGYISRLSRANCCNVGWLWHLFEKEINNKAQINRDLTLNQINNLKNEKMFSVIAKAVYLNKSDIKKMTIKSLISHFSKNYTKFCPQCLRENHYHRKHWQSDFAIVCLEHSTILQDICIRCGKRIELNDIISGFCTCGADLTKNEILLCNEDSAIQCQKRIYKALNVYSDKDFISIRKFPRLKPKEFLNFLDVMKGSFHYWFDLLLKHSKVCCDKETKDIFYLVFLEEIIYDWPRNFILFLDEIHRSPHIFKAYEERYFKIPIKSIRFSADGTSNLNFYETIVVRYTYYSLGLFKKYNINPLYDNKKILFKFIKQINGLD